VLPFKLKLLTVLSFDTCTMFVMLKIMFLTFQSVDNQCFLILFKMVTIGKRHLYRVNSIRRRVRQCDKFGPFSTI